MSATTEVQEIPADPEESEWEFADQNSEAEVESEGEPIMPFQLPISPERQTTCETPTSDNHLQEDGPAQNSGPSSPSDTD